MVLIKLLWKKVGQYLMKLKTLFDPIMLLINMYPRPMKSYADLHYSKNPSL